jgi:flagellar M-ring protein FliF
LDPAAGEAIARLVARSVVGLEVENIEITDQNMNSVFSGIKKNQSAANAEDEITGAKRRELEGKIQNSLKPLFDDVQIVSNLVFDWDRAKTVSRVYEPPIADSETGALSSSITESQKVTNGAAGNEMGLGANDAQTPEYNLGGTGNGTASVKSEENNYIYNETESITEKSAGALAPERSNMFISCYRYVNHYQQTLEENGQLEGTNWETYKNTLVARRIEIDPDLTENIRRGTGIENVSIIGFEVPVFVDRIFTDAGPDRKFLAVMGVLAALIALLALGVFKTAAPVEALEGMGGALESESEILSSRIEREKEEELTKMDLEYKKDSDTKVKIEKFVDEKPEAVAQLLRNWIQDD